MIDWINTRDHPVPKDGDVYLGLWKGAFCLIQYEDGSEGDCGYYIALYPATYTNSGKPLDEESMHKLYYWAKLTYPQEWLDIPIPPST